jgi:hypothetical protein
MSHELVFLIGCAGGTFDELLHWGAIRRKSTFPTYAKTITYWVVTFLLVCFGGLIAFLAVISTDYTIKPLTVFVIGFSAPALVKKLSKIFLKSPSLGASLTEPRPSIRNFLSE